MPVQHKRMHAVLTRMRVQIAIVIMHLSRQGVNSDAIVILMAMQCILLWLRLQYYLRCGAGSHACMHEQPCHGVYI